MKKIASSLFAFALLGLAFACTSTTTTTTSDPVDGGGDAGKGGTSDAGKKDSGGGSSTDDDTDTETTCADEADSDSCINCCADQHQAGAQVYQETIVECVCKPANCATECAETVCAETPANPDQACNDCFAEKSANCQQDLQDKCGSDPECVAFNNCAVESGCDDK